MTAAYVDPQTIHDPATGTSPPASWGDTVRDDIEGLAKPPGCVVVQAGSVSIANETLTNVEFGAADERDTDGFHDVLTDNEKLTVPAGLGGWYNLSGFCSWAANDTGRRYFAFSVNASTYYELWDTSATAGASNPTRVNGSVDVFLNAGDYVQVIVYQQSGAPLSLTSCRVSMRRVAVS